MPRREQPLSLRVLGLASLAIGIVTLALLGAIGYTLYREADYLMGELQAGPRQELVRFNGTHLLVDLELPNRGALPLELGLSSTLQMEDLTLAETTLGPFTIPPGGSKRVVATLPLTTTALLARPEVVGRLLFQPLPLNLTLNLTAGIAPFMTIRLAGSLAREIGPLLEDLVVGLDPPELVNETHVRVPVRLAFTSRLPAPVEGSLTLRVLATPLHPEPGLYAEGSTGLRALPDKRFEAVIPLTLSLEELQGEGEFLVEFVLETPLVTHSWRESFSPGG